MHRIYFLIGFGIAFNCNAYATSTFQNSCSNIRFAYVDGQATLQADCLNENGQAQEARLTLQGISNQNGKLVQGSGASSFQKNCGNIRVNINSTDSVSISAYCDNSNGDSVSTSLPLNGIVNKNGELVQ